MTEKECSRVSAFGFISQRKQSESISPRVSGVSGRTSRVRSAGVLISALSAWCLLPVLPPLDSSSCCPAAAECEFLKLYSGRWQKASAYAYNNDFKSVLGRLMVEHSVAQRDDKVALIGDQLQEIKGVMARNIELVLDRGEKIEILVTKSEAMEEHAFRFSKRATGLKRHFCCANAKYNILGLLIVLAIIYVIMAFACGGPKLGKCF